MVDKILILTFDFVASKALGIIFSLESTSVGSMVTIKGHKILIRHRMKISS